MSEGLIATMLVLAAAPDAAAQGPIDPTPPPAVQAPTNDQARAAEPATDRTDDWLNLQNNTNADVHHLEIYGFAQFDAIQDFNRVNPAWDATLR